jgi:hypothetical protein
MRKMEARHASEGSPACKPPIAGAAIEPEWQIDSEIPERSFDREGPKKRFFRGLDGLDKGPLRFAILSVGLFYI